MSNPYGWSQPTDGQPAVYFAPPGENIRVSDSADNSAPADNGFGAYQSFMDQYQYVPQHDPFARSASTFNPFQSLSARGARTKVSIIDATILWLKNWRNFSGRASRSEYWGVQIVQVRSVSACTSASRRHRQLPSRPTTHKPVSAATPADSEGDERVGRFSRREPVGAQPTLRRGPPRARRASRQRHPSGQIRGRLGRFCQRTWSRRVPADS